MARMHLEQGRLSPTLPLTTLATYMSQRLALRPILRIAPISAWIEHDVWGLEALGWLQAIANTAPPDSRTAACW